MQLNVLNDLAKAKRRWTGKKKRIRSLLKWSTQMCVMICQSPNLLQPRQPAVAAARENELNLMSHKTDFSELSKEAGYYQRRRPTIGPILQLFCLLLAGDPWLDWHTS